MKFDALTSNDRVEPLFPNGHPLARLVRPTFDTIRRTFRDLFVSTIWIDSAIDPARAGYRPSYELTHGPGSGNIMSFVGAWLSTGGEGNTVLFPEQVDKTLIEYGRAIGLCGKFEIVPSIDAMKERVAKSGRRIYNIDDLGAEFDAHQVVSSELSRWANSKDELPTLTSFGPHEAVKDMYDVTRADFEAAKREDGRVFLKTCNTENAGLGVFIANTYEEFELHLAGIRDRQKKFDLSRRIVIQPEIKGRNMSFQALLDPRDREHVQVIALTDQLVQDDGKTYLSSVNHAITAENVAPVGAAILDLADHVWARHPDAFGFLMADYFATDRGPVVYDPGFRPTGNTATAMAAHLARKITGRHFTSKLVPLPTRVGGLTYAEFCKRVGPLADPTHLGSSGRAVLPWGWNPIQGFGMIIAVAEDRESVDALGNELLSTKWA
jgi:hypothetical protein